MSHAAGQRKAFTLIELLVVIALIALLIGLLLPSLKRSMQLASATVCQHNLREIGRSLMEYRIENDGWLPVSNRMYGGSAVQSPGGGTASAQAPQNFAWFVKLHPTYLPDPLTLMCPDDPYGFRLAGDRSHLRDPAAANYPSYGMNGFMMAVGGGYLANLDRYQPMRPHDTILAADLGPDRVGRIRRTETPTVGPSRNGSMMLWNDGFDPFSGLPANPWVTMRHSHGINMLTWTGGIRDVNTEHVLRSPIRKRYDNCASGGCTLCRYFKLFHYSFAHDHLYWWTGPLPPRG